MFSNFAERLCLAAALASIATGSSLPPTEINLSKPGIYNNIQIEVQGMCGTHCVYAVVQDNRYPMTYVGVLSKTKGLANIRVTNQQLSIQGDIR